MNQEFFDLQQLLQFADKATNSRHTGYYAVGYLEAPAAARAQQLLGLTSARFQLLLDSHGIRHTLTQHGAAKSQLELARGQLPVEAADLLTLTQWLTVPTSVQAGQSKPGKQPRLELEWLTATARLVVIVEWRPRRRQLALVTMYKKRPTS